MKIETPISVEGFLGGLLLRPDGTFAVFDQVSAYNAAQILFPGPWDSTPACQSVTTFFGRTLMFLRGAGELPKNPTASQLCGEVIHGPVVLLSP